MDAGALGMLSLGLNSERFRENWMDRFYRVLRLY